MTLPKDQVEPGEQQVWSCESCGKESADIEEYREVCGECLAKITELRANLEGLPSKEICGHCSNPYCTEALEKYVRLADVLRLLERE